MREIRFRVWDFGAKHYCEVPHMMNVHTGAISDSTTRFEIEQFTGLKDKTGKDIYEGDILRHGLVVGAVRFDGIGYYLANLFHDNGYVLKVRDYEESEIIGNHHEGFRE